MVWIHGSFFCPEIPVQPLAILRCSCCSRIKPLSSSVLIEIFPHFSLFLKAKVSTIRMGMSLFAFFVDFPFLCIWLFCSRCLFCVQTPLKCSFSSVCSSLDELRSVFFLCVLRRARLYCIFLQITILVTIHHTLSREISRCFLKSDTLHNSQLATRLLGHVCLHCAQCLIHS